MGIKIVTKLLNDLIHLSSMQREHHVLVKYYKKRLLLDQICSYKNQNFIQVSFNQNITKSFYVLGTGAIRKLNNAGEGL